MQPKAVLLDLYETCAFGDWSLLREPMSEMLGVDRATLDQAFTSTRPVRNIGVSADLVGEAAAILEALGRDGDRVTAQRMANQTMAFVAREVQLYPDTMPVVRELRSRGASVVLVSNCSWETPPFVDRMGLREAFDGVMLSVERGVRKPDPAAYELALELAGGVDPADALFVDDQVLFCDGAKALGIPAWQIRRPRAKPATGIPSVTGDQPIILSLEELLSPTAGTLGATTQ